MDDSFTPASLLGHLAAFLLVASVLVPAQSVARIAAIAAGAGAFLYAVIGIGSVSVAFWSGPASAVGGTLT